MYTFYEDQIREALRRPLPGYVNNLRPRDEILQKDCYIRGVLGEIFVRDILKNYGFITKSNENSEDNTDRDLLIYGLNTTSSQIQFQKAIKIEIKTSLIPNDKFSYIDNGDVKIYKKTNKFEDDIYWDFGIQIYFNKCRKPWGECVQNICEKNQHQEELLKLYSQLKFDVFWISRQNAICVNNSLGSEQTWSYAYKTFWKCPIRTCNPSFYELIICLLDNIINAQYQEILILKNYISTNNNAK
ncbi:hypothetical protein HPU229336_04110 [Helicobacter pullorum]|uniref:Restriction endonuclease n=1 Tax=Helicobacter pullorum TaxID=35818 RepID=A0AAW3J3M8_9HELI|nr:hypothetical protein [Helicobacter pullorum]KPH50188.1 hypothetical protein HPU229336_04110 [Helicobacter pullorum]